MLGGMGQVIFVIAGIFGGIGIFLATMYSFVQVLLTQGRLRFAHAGLFVLMMAIFTVLYLWRDVFAARIISLPLIPIALWAVWLEQRWFKIFPILVAIFAGIIAMGYIALTPL
jgi:hypothetical protein